MSETKIKDGDTDRTATGEPTPQITLLLESLLFVAQEPVAMERLASVLGVDLAQVDQALVSLADQYEHRGLRLQRARSRIQMVTAPEAAEYVRRFLGLEARDRLSPPALETLAIVAYRQPATRAEIEAIRGVNCDSVLRTLVNHGLIEETGRLDQAGRPIIYGTTFEFLQGFGLSGVDQLPPLPELPERDGQNP